MSIFYTDSGSIDILAVSQLSASSGITGSLFGTASYANVAQTLLGTVTSASYADTASYVQLAQSASYATFNISAGTTSNDLSNLVFSNSNGVSFGLNGSTITATVNAGAANLTISAGTVTNAVSSLVFSNSNNISFGLNGSTITATAASSLTNINISAGTTSNNISALVFANVPGLSFGLNSNTITGNAAINFSAGTTSNDINNQIVFGNANNHTFGINASTLTVSYQAPINSYYENIVAIQGTNTSNFATNANLVQPFILPYDISVSYIRVPIFFSFVSSTFGTTNNTSFQYRQTQTYFANLYSMGVGASSKSLQYITQASISLIYQASATQGANSNQQTQAFAFTWYSEGQTTSQNTYSITNVGASNFSFGTGVLSSVSGLRMIDLALATSLQAGDYWIAFQRSSATATTNLAGVTNVSLNNQFGFASQPTILGFGQNSTDATIFQQQPGVGSWSATNQGGTTDSIGLSQIRSAVSFPRVPFQLIRFA